MGTRKIVVLQVKKSFMYCLDKAVYRTSTTDVCALSYPDLTCPLGAATVHMQSCAGLALGLHVTPDGCMMNSFPSEQSGGK